MNRVYVEQLIDEKVVRGYLTQKCDLTDYEEEAGEFTLEQIGAVLPTLDYDGCELLSVKIDALVDQD